MADLYSENELSNIILLKEKFGVLLSDIEKLSKAGDLSDYKFVLACTGFYKKMTNTDILLLNFVLSLYEKQNDDSPIIEKSIAFTAFYCICLYHYRENNAELLHQMLENYVSKEIGDKLFSFEEYPIIWDLACRLCVINEDFIKQLSCAKLGIKVLPQNVALKISYVDAICTWLYSAYCTGTTYDKDDIELPDTIKYKLSNSSDATFNEEQIITALGYVKSAIDYNKKYAKYYYYLAQLIFYCRFYYEKRSHYQFDMNNDTWNKAFNDIKKDWNIIEITWNDITSNSNLYVIKQIEKLINKAVLLTNKEDEKNRYYQFIDFMKSAYTYSGSSKLYSDKHAVLRSRSAGECRNIVKCSKGEPYVIISYSWKDYKSVFCDILELQSRGINIYFDDKLSEMPNESSLKWYEQYEILLKKAEYVICYLSHNSILSKSVMKELKMIKDNKKAVIPIDISGKGIISKIIAEAIKRVREDEMSSENMNLITSIFYDEVLLYTKSQNDDSNGHLHKIITIFNENLNLVNPISINSDISNNYLENGIPLHPQEDVVLADSKNSIFIVADGITRNEGYGAEGHSLSKMIADFFCENMKSNIIKWLETGSTEDSSHILKNAFISTNEDLANYIANDEMFLSEMEEAKLRGKGKYFETPGCVAIVAMIHHRRLYYGYVGDCAAVLVRKKNKMAITHDQTYYAFKIENIEREREKLYKYYVNNNTNVNGYGVITGDSNVINFFDVASIDLQSDDTVYIMSDGISDYIRNYPVDLFNNKTVDKIFKQHEKIMANKFVDDRAMIQIKIK